MARPAIRILGVDTALRCTGLGVVESTGTGLAAVAFGTVRNPAAWPHSRCLRRLHDEVGEWVARYAPEAAALEGVFFCRNARSALALGEARGAVLTACARAGLPAYEYAPSAVKQAVSGWGRAGKAQVAKMVVALLGMKETPPEDAADALALAVCHWQHRTPRELGTLKPV